MMRPQVTPRVAGIRTASRSTLPFYRRPAFRDAMAGYLFLLPGFIPMLVFSLLAIFAAFGLSLVHWTLLQPWTFVGLANYRKLLTDPEFWRAMRVSATFMVVVVPVGMVISLALALALNRGLRGTVIYRTLYFLPVITSTVAVALLWRWLYASGIGLINTLLALVGIEGPNWLGDATWALPAVMIMSIWKGLGYTMILFLAGLQSIPETYYEAAKIDGANAWARFRYVTIPLLSPTTFFILVVGVIGSLQVFDQVFIMTNGGPYRTTITASFFIYETGFKLLNMGYASSAALMLFVIIFIATLFQIRMQNRWVHYE